ncbi:unnamed protein product (macronuclear) [Paramecium tetraurelia]|uniref:Transmembrane protein n=1 Tax=Paramecium tetraurelia TaxID=5888 RepID=A0CJ91_PARTE|nr:uncharacterized protein GSPATT00000567001 [Paramecium tetraurelia]CAK70858.1 unnamed protein product [Paramecium tetraurelia]|eukprot:XP_001438255.1 hypothetical protein (macronuclear) [Paramecium tetraurelia strain d4-2]
MEAQLFFIRVVFKTVNIHYVAFYGQVILVERRIMSKDMFNKQPTKNNIVTFFNNLFTSFYLIREVWWANQSNYSDIFLFILLLKQKILISSTALSIFFNLVSFRIIFLIYQEFAINSQSVSSSCWLQAKFTTHQQYSSQCMMFLIDFYTAISFNYFNVKILHQMSENEVQYNLVGVSDLNLLINHIRSFHQFNFFSVFVMLTLGDIKQPKASKFIQGIMIQILLYIQLGCQDLL